MTTPSQSHVAGMELLPCPFCGATELDVAVNASKPVHDDYIMCNGTAGCGAMMSRVDAVMATCLAPGIDAPNPPPEPVQGEAVRFVGYLFTADRDVSETFLSKDGGFFAHHRSEPLMTVAQHNRIMAALQQPDVRVHVTGTIDEIDAPVWPFINAEALKVCAEKGRIESYRYERANGGVVVLWDGPRVHAMAVTIRDDLNRTRCVRMLAAARPDAELVALLLEWTTIFSDGVAAGPLMRLRERTDAKLAELRKCQG